MIDMSRKPINEMPLNGSHPTMINAVANLRVMIETDVKNFTKSVGREPNPFEETAFVEKAIKAVCGSLTPQEGHLFLAVVGARQS